MNDFLPGTIELPFFLYENTLRCSPPDDHSYDYVKLKYYNYSDYTLFRVPKAGKLGAIYKRKAWHSDQP